MEKQMEETDQKLKKEIMTWLKKRNAILLAHNYQPPEIQDMADLCGDSLELSIKASSTDSEVIVFCGVHFMAETASILSPDKTVLLPVLDAGCPMADMITAEQLRKKKRNLPDDTTVVSYVNTTAEVKAESDICCTSANVMKVVESVEPEKPILMTPDKNLAQYAARHTDRVISYWDGYCPIHNNLTAEQVQKVKQANPGALFLAHPECRPEVLDLADEIKSTSGMIAYTKEADQKTFIIGTEVGILYPLKKASPDKTFVPADDCMVCLDMKKTGLQDILASLETLRPEVRVPLEMGKKARASVDRMVEIF